jgi:hypothetical protein
MLGTARLSPATRAIRDLDARVARLERFALWKTPTKFDFEAVVGKGLWSRHWANWEKLYALMHECEKTAVEIRAVIGRSLEA